MGFREEAESCRKAEGVFMDQIGVEGEDSLVMAEALMLALRKWGRKRIPIGGVKQPLSSKRLAKLGVRGGYSWDSGDPKEFG